MKKIIVTIIWLPIFILGQSDLYPVDEFYGGGIGYSPMFMALDSIPGGDALKKLGLNPNNFTTPFVLHGGEGLAQIAGRWRIGGYAGVGSSRISTVPTVKLFINRDGDVGYQSPPAVVPDPSVIDTTILYLGNFAPSIQAKFTFALGAVAIEYVIPIFRDLEIATGALLGLGRVNLSINQSIGTPRWSNQFNNAYGMGTDSTIYYEVDTTGFTTITDAFTDAQNSILSAQRIPSRYTSLSGTFFNFQPYVAVKWQVLDRVGLRVSIGFNKGTIPAGRWYLNDREPISDSPKSALQGVTIRTMLYFGI